MPLTIAFATQPADANVVVGSVTGNMTVLAVVSDGNTPTYQWYSIATDANTSGDAVSGATNATPCHTDSIQRRNAILLL